MYISKRCFVRIISFFTAISVAAGISATLNMNSSVRYKRNFEQSMTRNVEDLSAEIDNIKNTLYKGMYAGTPEMMTQLSSKLWSDASTAKASLAELPVSELHLENTYKFLSQVGNFSKSLAKRYSDGETLTEDDRKSLKTLGEYADRLADNMWKVEQRITNGELSFEKAATEVQEAKNSDEPSYITEGFTDFEEGYDNYPTLIYDGPFSDHILEKNPEMLKSASAVTLSDALKKAEKACGTVGLSHDDKNGVSDIWLHRGYQSLDAEKALSYMRYIDAFDGEIGRIQREERFIKAMISQMQKNFPFVNWLYAKYYWKAAETNITSSDAASIAYELTKIPIEDIRFIILPGELRRIDKQNIWIANPVEIQKIIGVTLGQSNE